MLWAVVGTVVPPVVLSFGPLNSPHNHISLYSQPTMKSEPSSLVSMQLFPDKSMYIPVSLPTLSLSLLSQLDIT